MNIISENIFENHQIITVDEVHYVLPEEWSQLKNAVLIHLRNFDRNCLESLSYLIDESNKQHIDLKKILEMYFETTPHYISQQNPFDLFPANKWSFGNFTISSYIKSLYKNSSTQSAFIYPIINLNNIENTFTELKNMISIDSNQTLLCYGTTYNHAISILFQHLQVDKGRKRTEFFYRPAVYCCRDIKPAIKEANTISFLHNNSFPAVVVFQCSNQIFNEKYYKKLEYPSCINHVKLCQTFSNTRNKTILDNILGYSLSLFYVIEGPQMSDNKQVQIAFSNQNIIDEYMKPIGILVLNPPINVQK